MKKLSLIFAIALANSFLFSCKKDSSSTSSTVPPTNAIVASDTFKISSGYFIPTSKTTSSTNGKWIVQANYNGQAANANPKNSDPYTSDLRIIFSGSSRVSSSGNFLIQTDSTKLSIGQVYIRVSDYSFGPGCACGHNDTGHATSGQIQVSVESNGQIHIIFKDIDAIDNHYQFNGDIPNGNSSSTFNIKIAANISCY